MTDESQDDITEETILNFKKFIVWFIWTYPQLSAPTHDDDDDSLFHREALLGALLKHF